MREAAVDALLPLYAVPANLSPMHAFTERFQQRIAELVRPGRKPASKSASCNVAVTQVSGGA